MACWLATGIMGTDPRGKGAVTSGGGGGEVVEVGDEGGRGRRLYVNRTGGTGARAAKSGREG